MITSTRTRLGYPKQLRLLSSVSKPTLYTRSPLDIKTKIRLSEEQIQTNDNRFITHPTFPHPAWTNEECDLVKFEHRVPRTIGDSIAYNGTMFFRSCFDFVTGYKKPKSHQDLLDGFKGTRYQMTEGKWLTRVLFLESIAAVPGSAAAWIRTLHSVRRLQRDHGWIETLLDEAYNERMHLLTFVKIGNPSWFTKTCIFLGQGIFTNAFFFMYLFNPKYCHRFVGHLEEEAVSTYTHLLEEIDLGRLPKFDEVKIPQIAYEYWPELNKDSSFRELIARIRADESKHREVNHTLANLDQKTNRNPFVLQLPNVKGPQPNGGLKEVKPTGWDKKDLIL